MDWNKGACLVITLLQVPAFCCAIFICLQFAQRTSPLRRIQNRILIYLLIVVIWTIGVELPNTQNFLWSGWVSVSTPWFCSLWNASFFSTASINRTLMAFMSIERHLLVFQPQFYHTHRSRLIFHYIPLITLISIILIFMFVFNVFISCPKLIFNYSLFMCGYTCMIRIDNVGTIYAWLYVFLPTSITTLACISLPIRFVIQKRQLQRVQWNRARKLIVQTSIIASAYTISWLPYSVILQLLLNNYLSFYDTNIIRFLEVVPYVTSLLTPFIVFHTIREQIECTLWKQIKRRFFPQSQGLVRPINNNATIPANPLLNEQRNVNEQQLELN